MKSPFKFLDAYTLEDKGVFFGREEETDALYSMVFKTPLLMVYGQSGTGKTSLVQCGLAGRFDGPDWYPFFLRRGEDINTALDETIAKALPKGEPLRPNLEDNISILFRYYLRPVYLILDQFEELFILGTPEEQETFARRLNKLISAELPCKVLLIIREEFIGQLYPIERIIPTLYDYRLRVEPMGFKKVETVIRQSCEQFNIALEDTAANIKHIYDNISAGKSGVQLPYLQVYLDMLYQEDFARTYPKIKELPSPLPPLQFTSQEIKQFGRIEDVLGRFLTMQINGLEKAIKEKWHKAPEKTVHRVLDIFATEQGTKRPVRYERKDGDQLVLEQSASQWLSDIPVDTISFLCKSLIGSRLLRQTDETIELAHDALAALVDNRRSDQQRRQNEVFNRLLSNFQEFSETGEHLTRRQLNSIEEFIPLFEHRLTAGIKEFIAGSYQKAEKTEHAALDEERKKRKSARRIAIVGFALAMFALVAAGIAIKETSVARNAQKSLAEKAFALQIQYAENLKLEGKYDEAIKQLEKIEQFTDDISPQSHRILDSLNVTWPKVEQLMKTGDEYRKNADLKKALEYYQQALNTGSDNRIIIAINETQKDLEKSFNENLARATDFLLVGQVELAIQYFKVCLNLKPDHPVAKSRLDRAMKLIKGTK